MLIEMWLCVPYACRSATTTSVRHFHAEQVGTKLDSRLHDCTRSATSGCEENGRVHGRHVVVAVVANFTLAYNLVNALVVYTLHQLP